MGIFSTLEFGVLKRTTATSPLISQLTWVLSANKHKAGLSSCSRDFKGKKKMDLQKSFTLTLEGTGGGDVTAGIT